MLSRKHHHTVGRPVPSRDGLAVGRPVYRLRWIEGHKKLNFCFSVLFEVTVMGP